MHDFKELADPPAGIEIVVHGLQELGAMLGDFAEQGGSLVREFAAADGCGELVESLAGSLREPLERAVKRLQAAIDFVEATRPEIDRPAIMARKKQRAQRVRLVGF